MYEREMRKCFRLALKGIGKTSPNPLVGCVILDKTGKELATGYHSKYGENHAERDAILKLTKSQTQGGTIIVNLEPCNHYGKTPPCSDLIIEYGFNRVVISNTDPNPKAAGGINKLKQAGIEVITGVLEKEGLQLNRIFFKNITKKKPYIITKTATTIDGKTATKTGDSKWITSANARKLVKKFRSHYDAILTTSSTILADNPEMKHKAKIILDRTSKLDLGLQIFKQGEIILVTATKELTNLPSNIKHLQVTEIDEKLNLQELFDKLFTLGIKSIFVEAGAKLNGDLIKNSLADEIIHFVAPKILNDNSGMSCFDGDSISLISGVKQYELIELKQCLPDYYARYLLHS